MPRLLIETTGLTKRYGARVAVDHAGLQVRSGEVSGFLGPNGAGKTPTLPLLLGLCFLPVRAPRGWWVSRRVTRFQPPARRAAAGLRPRRGDHEGKLRRQGGVGELRGRGSPRVVEEDEAPRVNRELSPDHSGAGRRWR